MMTMTGMLHAATQLPSPRGKRDSEPVTMRGDKLRDCPASVLENSSGRGISSTRFGRVSSTCKLGIVVVFFLGQSAGSSLFAQYSIPGSRPDAEQLARDVFHNEIDAQIHDQSLWSYRELKEEDGKKKLFDVARQRMEKLTAFSR